MRELKQEEVKNLSCNGGFFPVVPVVVGLATALGTSLANLKS